MLLLIIFAIHFNLLGVIKSTYLVLLLLLALIEAIGTLIDFAHMVDDLP